MASSVRGYMEKEPRKKVIKGLRTQMEICRQLETEGFDMTALVEPTLEALELEGVLYDRQKDIKHE